MNLSSNNSFAIALDQVFVHLQKQSDLIPPEKPLVKITQRKAKYHDKTRTRRKDVQAWVFRRTGLNTTNEVKRYLLKLGQSRDFRLSAAWIDTNINYADAIAALVKAELQCDSASALAELRGFASPVLKVGDRVSLIEYTARLAHLESWSPFLILEVADGKAKLELISFPVPVDKLQLETCDRTSSAYIIK